jgi:hypothetical protein
MNLRAIKCTLKASAPSVRHFRGKSIVTNHGLIKNANDLCERRGGSDFSEPTFPIGGKCRQG